jgi:hypothetical protein
LSQKPDNPDKKPVVEGEVVPPAVVAKVKQLSKQWNLSEGHVWEMMEKEFIMGHKDTDYRVNSSTSSQFLTPNNNSNNNNPDSSLAFMREFFPMIRDMKGGDSKGNGNNAIDMNTMFMFGMMKSMFAPPPPVQGGMTPEMMMAISGNKGDPALMAMIMEDKKTQQAEVAASRAENTAMMNTMMQGLLGKSQSDMQELIKSQGVEHKMDLEKVKMEFVARMGAGGDPNSIDNVAMSAYRDEMTKRIKDLVQRGFIPEKSIMNEKGEIDPAGAFDKIIGLGREFMGMVGEFAKNQPATAPPQRVPVSIPATGPVPAPAAGAATIPVTDPPPPAQGPPVDVPTTTTPLTERNGMEIIGVKIKATTPR